MNTRLYTRLNLPANVRYSLTVVMILLALNFILRLAFLLYNTAQASAISMGELAMGFLVGVRFDLATIFIFNGLILMFLALPIQLNRRPATYKVCNILIILANVPVLLVNMIDVVYYGFSEKRMTHELFTTKSDFQSFKPEMLLEWWWLFAMFGVLIFLFYRVLSRFSHRHLMRMQEEGYMPRPSHWGVAVLFALLMYTGIRGGLQRTPLWSGKAFIGERIFVGNLGLNSAFTVLSAVEWGKEEPVNLIQDGKAMKICRDMVRNSFDGPFVSETYPFLRQARFEEPENRFNVVFLIIESLNAKHVGCIAGHAPEESLTPNLDTLIRHGRMYTHYYSNGVRSVEAVPALVNSMPEIFMRPTIGSRYSRNNHYGLGNIFRERGYHNAFFCGSHNGTMGFDKYAPVCGIDHYFGMDEYPHRDRDFDGYWGCYDGPFTQWMAEKQNAFQEPFFSVWFSISNHHPFVLPPLDTDDIAARDITDMEKTVMYTDRALGEYFRTVRNYDWYDRTIFIVTGDHCFHEESEPDRTIMENFHVPLFLVAPCLEPGLDDRLGNHVNVMPTVIDLLKLNTYHCSAGVSLLEADRSPFVINNLMGVVTLAKDSLAYSTNFERVLPHHRLVNGVWKKDEMPLDPAVEAEMDGCLRSLYQEMLNLRIQNRFQIGSGGGAQHLN